jgi:uncharacterized protein YjbJ (UPF0337 family)
MNRDQAKEGLKASDGKSEEVARRVIGKKRIQDKGTAKWISGKLQGSYRDLKDILRKRDKE